MTDRSFDDIRKDLDRDMAELLGKPYEFKKDTAPPFIKPGYVYSHDKPTQYLPIDKHGNILDNQDHPDNIHNQGHIPVTIGMDETILASPPEPLSDILKRVDDQEIREDVFLQAVQTELISQQSRLRHRAEMMRRRADQFDADADDIERRIETIRGFVESIMDGIAGTEAVLNEHAHIEPEVVK